MVILYDQFNRPIKQAKSKPERRPLASAPLTDVYREYVTSGLTPERLARILKEADAGDLRRQAELFDQIEERDGHIIGDISKRRNVILDADFTLSPASEDRKNVAVYEDVKEMLDGITDWPDVLESMQDAVGKGFSSFEMDWDVSEGQAQVQKFDFLEQKRFSFIDEKGLICDVPRLITDDAPMGVDIPAWKVMMHRYGGKSGSAVKSGLYRICAWWFLFKNYSIKDWLLFCEIYGMPLRLGKYDPGASKEDKQALAIAVRTIGSDAAGIISKSTEIEFKEGSKGSVNSDLYKGIPDFANKEMSKAILGGTLTSDVDGKGSYAASNTHNDVRHDLINADARSIAATVRNQLIRPYVGFNYGWDTAIPKYEGRFKKEDLKAHAEMLDKFSDKMDIPVSHVRDKFNIPKPEKGEECLRAKNSQISTPVKSKLPLVAKQENNSRNANLDILDMVLGRLEKESDVHVQKLLEPVRKIMAKSASLEELKDKLFEAYPDMDAGALGAVIEKAMTVSDLMGRYEVDTDA
ncbi:MAG: DUF935 domain-containing protein [Desulfobacula sp.]|nr:DUF935 domain-containing protein [Desulfobacula sp.]